MPITYESMDEGRKAAARDRIAPTTPVVVDTAAFLPAWEEEHYSHTLLREAALAKKDEEAVANHDAAIATLEKAITDARATRKPVTPIPPAPTPTPAPTPPAPRAER